MHPRSTGVRYPGDAGMPPRVDPSRVMGQYWDLPSDKVAPGFPGLDASVILYDWLPLAVFVFVAPLFFAIFVTSLVFVGPLLILGWLHGDRQGRRT